MSSEFESVTIVEHSPENFRILLVDDEKIMRDLLKDIITQSFGYEVDLASSAEEGLKKYKKGLHQIIVMDIRLGGKMNGLDLLKKIHTHDKLVNIIMITGYATIDLAVECMRSGAWDFITKPFSYDHFELVIKRAVENLDLKKLAGQRDYYMQLSRLDSLTEVFNRRLFDIILKNEVANAKRHKRKFALLFMDLDNFKYINDVFGHPKGDEVLKMVALTMKSFSRESDFLCRYGGDEFAFILPETPKDGARIFANRLKDKVEALEIEGKATTGEILKHKISVSIGAVCFPDGALTLEGIVQKADEFLLEAKKVKNRIVLG